VRRLAHRLAGQVLVHAGQLEHDAAGLDGATQCSGEPLPEPMRVSSGFLVMERSGKIVIRTLPPRLMARVIAIRAASICRAVIQPGLIAIRP
jgi:hypothetical protein